MLKEIEYFSSEALTTTISDFIIISINTISNLKCYLIKNKLSSVNKQQLNTQSNCQMGELKIKSFIVAYRKNKKSVVQ